MQPQPYPAQSPNTTKTGQFHGGTHSGQGGGLGHHRPGGLHKQSPSITTRHQHLQSSHQGYNQSPQKQTHFPSQGHQTNQEASTPTSTNNYTPPVAVLPKFYGLPKVHKVGTPLRPIVSCRGSITYGVAKELSYIIKPLVGQSPHHLKTHNISYNSSRVKRWNQGRSSPSLM